MPGTLDHSPAKIVRQLLVDLSLGTDPAAGGSWPVYYSRSLETQENTISGPRVPDDAITVLDQTDQMGQTTMTDGVKESHHGLQVIVRSAKDGTGWTKANAIKDKLDALKLTDGKRVTIGGSTYVIDCFDRTSGPLSAKEPNSNRRLISINYVGMLWKA